MSENTRMTEIVDSVTEQKKKADKLARDVLKLSRNTLLVNLRFLDAALSRLIPHPYETLATDGQYLLYDARQVLNSYKRQKEEPVRSYLHMVLHCVFRHMYIHTQVDHDCWDLACDIAVENIINELGLAAVTTEKAQKQQDIISELRREVHHLTAEKLYRYYLDKQLPHITMATLQDTFRADDHQLWYSVMQQPKEGGRKNRQEAAEAQDNNDGEPPQDGGRDTGDSGDQPPEEQPSPPTNQRNDWTPPPQDKDDRGDQSDRTPEIGAASAQREQDWQDISERIQTDLETFSKNRGDEAGDLLQNLTAVNREKYDYTSFLKKFAVRGEVMQINDNEFDYIFYTYGLTLYENLPLIEPLEYKEVKRIRDFVIAIDTSGSVSGELVQSFIQKTYNILRSTESFFHRINLHIIQCDADIQEDVRITSQEEFDAYLETMEFHGFGGTDFRPVFARVDELLRNKELTNLKGLLYFTDGEGTFPAKKPDYDTAFVFVDDEYKEHDVPPWAIKLVLEKADIEDFA